MKQRFTHVTDVPLALGVFFASDNYDYSDDPYTISATTLLKPTRQIILSKRVPQELSLIKLSDQAKNRVGAAIHDAIESAWVNNYANAMSSMGYRDAIINRIKINPTKEQITEDTIPIYLEQRVTRKIGRWTVTGKFDFVGEGKVQDFKSTSTYTYTKQTNEDKYIQQGSIYRWLSPDIITQDVMEIHYLFTDWKAGYSSNPDYPSKPFQTQRFQLLTLGATELFIRQKLEALEKYKDAADSDIPLCTNDELWRSEPVFKYYKNPANTAGRSTKNFDTLQEARMRQIQDGNVGIIKEVPGQVKACHYCSAFSICEQKTALIASGDLII